MVFQKKGIDVMLKGIVFHYFRYYSKLIECAFQVVTPFGICILEPTDARNHTVYVYL